MPSLSDPIPMALPTRARSAREPGGQGTWGRPYRTVLDSGGADDDHPTVAG